MCWWKEGRAALSWTCCRKCHQTPLQSQLRGTSPAGSAETPGWGFHPRNRSTTKARGKEGTTGQLPQPDTDIQLSNAWEEILFTYIFLQFNNKESLCKYQLRRLGKANPIQACSSEQVSVTMKYFDNLENSVNPSTPRAQPDNNNNNYYYYYYQAVALPLRTGQWVLGGRKLLPHAVNKKKFKKKKYTQSCAAESFHWAWLETGSYKPIIHLQHKHRLGSTCSNIGWDF